MYLVIQKCSMHIEITSVCGQEGEIEAFKTMTVKLEQKPRKLVRQNGENSICTQPSCISIPDVAVVKGIVSESPCWPPLPTNVCTM